MSEIKVNKISPKQTCTTVTLGDSGDTFVIPSGVTMTNNGTATGFGATYNGAVNWDTTAKTGNFTAVSGNGYFINTTGGAITVTLPAGSAGDIVSLDDYSNYFNINNVTVSPNGTDKIGGYNENTILNIAGQSVTFVYVDETQGWKNIINSTANLIGQAFIQATGGTITTCGDYKVHTFTAPGTFCVSDAGSPTNNYVDYVVVAGGGGGGAYRAGGGGAGGFRLSNQWGLPAPTMSPLSNSCGATVTATAYPITVGAGGAAPTGPGPLAWGGKGSNSVFSTITSTGGGGGGADGDPPCAQHDGGSGGGAACSSVGPGVGGSGNTPPVSPSQGNPGGRGATCGPTPATPAPYAGGGGGGAGARGGHKTENPNNNGGYGGVGSYVSPAFAGCNGTTGPVPAVRYFAGGGGGAGCASGSPGADVPGGAGGGGPGGLNAPGGPAVINTGGGGGGRGTTSTPHAVPTAAGASGIVMIRYKFQ